MADIKFLNNISLENLQLNNAKLQVVASDPVLAGAEYEGRVIYNSADNAIKFHNGGTSNYWVKLDGSGDISSVTVQAGEGLEVEAGSNTASEGDFDVTLGLASTVAGDGLTYSAGVININDDDSTLTIDTDVLKIKDAGVTGTQIAADAVDGTKIADDSIDSEHYVDGSIDLAHLAADSVDGTKIVDDAIDSEHYTDGSIDLEHLAADSVDGTKIADDSIDSEHIVDGSVDNTHLANDGIIIGSTDVSLGDTITALVGLTDLDLTEAAHTIFDTVGANNLTMGASTTTVVIPGDLQVTGTVTTNNVETISTSNGVVFEGNAADEHEVTLLAATVTADRTATLPDKTGTLAMTSDISARYFSGLIGDGTATTLILKNTGASGTDESDHGLGTDSTTFMVQLVEVSTGATVFADVERAASGVVNVIFASAPASNAIRVLMTKIG
jgi:hypothetical protein